MRGEVAVAKGEPQRLGTVRGQLVHHRPALVPTAPAAVGISAAAERVHDRVKIRTDSKSMHSDVVRGVADDRDLSIRECAANPYREPRAANAASHDHDPHRPSFS